MCSLASDDHDKGDQRELTHRCPSCGVNSRLCAFPDSLVPWFPSHDSLRESSGCLADCGSKSSDSSCIFLRVPSLIPIRIPQNPHWHSNSSPRFVIRFVMIPTSCPVLFLHLKCGDTMSRNKFGDTMSSSRLSQPWTSVVIHIIHSRIIFEVLKRRDRY